MEQKILFKNFNTDKRVYNLNEGYWKRKLNSKLTQKFSSENILFKNYDHLGSKIYDANPIFTYLDLNKRKAIRIIQDDISEIKTEDLEFNNINFLISAWLDKITILNKNEDDEIDELVIALILTSETVEKTMMIITKWLNTELTEDEIDELINSRST